MRPKLFGVWNTWPNRYIGWWGYITIYIGLTWICFVSLSWNIGMWVESFML